MSSYAKRTDGNHAEIRDGLREAGYTVVDYSGVGGGIPDLLVISKCEASVWMEAKIVGGKLTKAEWRFFDTYTGLKFVVYSLEDALEKLYQIDKRAA